MNSEYSPTPREELEAQITALLLGELPENEAAALREKIAADPALLKLHTQIGMTIGLVKEAIASPEPAELAAPKGLKLSGEKREKLLGSFKVVKAPKAAREPIRIDFKSWGALAAMIVGLLAVAQWMIGSFFLKARTSAQKTRSVEFLRDEPVAQTAVIENSRKPNVQFGADGAKAKVIQEEINLGARFHQEMETLKRDGGNNVRIELPSLVADSESRGLRGTDLAADSNASAGQPVRPAPDGFYSFGGAGGGGTSAGRAFYDGSGSQQSAGGLQIIPTDLAPASTALSFGLSTASAADPLAVEAKDAWSFDTAGKPIQNLNVIAGGEFGTARLDAGVQVPKQEMEITRGFSQESRGEGLVVLQDFDASKRGGEKVGEENKPAEIRLGLSSVEAVDKLQQLRLPALNIAGAADELNREAIPTVNELQGVPTLIQNGQLIEAEKLLKEATAKNPDSKAVEYYLRTIDGERAEQEVKKHTTSYRKEVAQIDEVDQQLASLQREVETRQKLRDSVATRILQEKTDEKIPKRELVEQVDRAEAGEPKKLSLMERIRGVERSAKIEVAKDARDISPLLSSARASSYDPFFLQSEKERIQSAQVLDGVVEKLGLQTKWAEKFGGGQKLQREEARDNLRRMLKVEGKPNSDQIDVKVKSDSAEEAARIANAVVDEYTAKRKEASFPQRGIQALEKELAAQEEKLAEAKAQLQKLTEVSKSEQAAEKTLIAAAVPQPEVATAVNPFSTFSLNVSDVSFNLAAASLEKGVMPEAGGIRSEEFINAFDYRDPAAVSAPVAFAWERARYPFAHDRDLLRFSVKTAASGREAGKPLNLVLLLDASGSMERADRVRIIQECLRVLATQLQAQDRVSVVTFARTPRLWVDGLPGSAAGELVSRVGTVTPEGGTNLEEAMRVGYETAARHFATNGVNRVVLLTDGAANLGDVKPESLKKRVEENRKKGIALDCFGIGWEGLNDDLLEQLSRNGDGRYGFVNTPEAATTDFAQQLAGALKVAASDVKVQVEFNPKRATAYRQIGYAKHQLTKEQFRDNTVDAAEIGAAEAGNALYVVQVNPAGEGPIATVRARFKIPGTNDYREHEWAVAYEGTSTPLEQSTATLRLAGAASAFSEWMGASPYAGEVTPDRLLGLMANIPEAFSNDSRPKQLEWMIRQAKGIAGK